MDFDEQDQFPPPDDHPQGESALDLDDTGIGFPAAPVATRATRRQRVRIGRLALPVGATAWALSILFHGGLAVAACLLIRYVGLTIGGQPDGQAGASDVSLVKGQSPGPIVQPGLPQYAVAPDDHQPPLHKVESDEVPQDPLWTDHATRTALADPADAAPENNDFLVIGARGGSFTSSPAFHRSAGARQATGSPPAGGGGAAEASDGPSYPGLPGDLARKGFPKPNYPLEAQRRGQSGTVVIGLEIRADGSVGQIRVLQDPGYPMLRDAALVAAQKLRAYQFAPVRRDGRAVEWLAIIRYPFILK